MLKLLRKPIRFEWCLITAFQTNCHEPPCHRQNVVILQSTATIVVWWFDHCELPVRLNKFINVANGFRAVKGCIMTSFAISALTWNIARKIEMRSQTVKLSLNHSLSILSYWYRYSVNCLSNGAYHSYWRWHRSSTKRTDSLFSLARVVNNQFTCINDLSDMNSPKSEFT